LIVTGDGICQVAEDLKNRFNADTVGAVVLLGYEAEREFLPLGVNPHGISIKALGWYGDISKEVDDFRKSDLSASENIKFIGLQDHKAGIGSVKEDTMNTSTESFEEVLGIIVSGLEDFDRRELAAVASTLFGSDSQPSLDGKVKDLRKAFIRQANLIFQQCPARLQVVRNKVKQIVIETLERLDAGQ
jgi:hypothetical protein